MKVNLISTKHLKLRLVLLLSIFFFCQSCKKKTEAKVQETGSVTDVQGHTYNTVKIGEQWWMTENLVVTVFNDKTPIAYIPADSLNDWAKTYDAAYCLFDSRYGFLYNWFAVHNSRSIAPDGWHVPTDEDWKVLERTIGLDNSESENTGWRGKKTSEKLITESSTGWPFGSLIFGTNESGFLALPGGCRLFNGSSGEVSATGYWWTSTALDGSKPWYRNISAGNEGILRYNTDKHYGLSIRCVKN